MLIVFYLLGFLILYLAGVYLSAWCQAKEQEDDSWFDYNGEGTWLWPLYLFAFLDFISPHEVSQGIWRKRRGKYLARMEAESKSSS